ncbi:MAG: hypothetical protein AAFU41_14715 [Pseudomonadota bacterium]
MVKSAKKIFAVAALGAATVIVHASAGYADEVTLDFIANDLTISGELINMDDEGYTLITEMGEVHVPAAMVTCEGDACTQVAVVSDS